MLYFHKDKMNELIASPAFLQILLTLIAIFVTYLITLIVKKIINRTNIFSPLVFEGQEVCTSHLL